MTTAEARSEVDAAYADVAIAELGLNIKRSNLICALDAYRACSNHQALHDLNAAIEDYGSSVEVVLRLVRIKDAANTRFFAFVKGAR